MKPTQEIGEIVHDGTPLSQSPTPESPTPETDAATSGLICNVADARDLCRTLELERNRLRERVAALVPVAGSVAITYKQLESVLKDCRSAIQSAPGEDPPDGYEGLSSLHSEIADACWLDGMDQLSTALLNWCHDQVNLAPSPVAPAADAAPVPTPPLQWHPLFKHMDDEHKLTLLDSELHEIALKVDESRAAALTPEQEDGGDYWLLRTLANFMVNHHHECDREPSCDQSGDCITEWCEQCAAKAWLRDVKAREQAP